MGPSDRCNDRQPEAGAAATARGVGPREALERVEAGGEAGAVVADVEAPRAGARLGGELDVAAAVAPRVVEQVAERLLEPQRVASDDEAVGAGRNPRAGRPAIADAFQQLSRTQLLGADRQPPLVAARDHQQV